MWAQWDWGQGPTIDGRPDVSVLRLVGVVAVPGRDPDVGQDVADRDRLSGPGRCASFGGVPTYWLTDNERTVHRRPRRRDRRAASVDRRGRPPLRGHDRDVCARPTLNRRAASKRRSRSPRPIWCRPTPTCATTTRRWAELVDACEAFMDKVNGREHRITRRAPAEMLAEEQARLHRLPDAAFTAAFGETRKVSWSSTISFGGVTYSVPHTLADEVVWVRVDGDEIVATHVAGTGAVEVARHARSTPGNPTHRRRPLPAPTRRARWPANPRPTNAAEAEFLALGDGARMWLIEAAAAGHVAGEGEDGRRRPARPPARRRTGRLGARSRRHLRTVRRRRRRVDPRRAPRRATPARRRGPLDATLHRARGKASGRSPHDRRDRTDRRGRRPVAPVASAAHAPPRTRRVGHRQGATLGPSRSGPGVAHRRARRPAGVVDQHPPHRRRVPDRQDVRHLGRDRVVDPVTDPAVADAPSSGSTATRTSSSADRPAPAKPISSKRSVTPRSATAATSNGSPSRPSAR